MNKLVVGDPARGGESCTHIIKSKSRLSKLAITPVPPTIKERLGTSCLSNQFFSTRC